MWTNRARSTTVNTPWMKSKLGMLRVQLSGLEKNDNKLGINAQRSSLSLLGKRITTMSCQNLRIVTAKYLLSVKA